MMNFVANYITSVNFYLEWENILQKLKKKKPQNTINIIKFKNTYIFIN